MTQSKKILVVNVTAAEASGALTILKQVLDAIPESNDWEYFVFVNPNADIKCDKENIHLIPIAGVKSFLKRFMWDSFGVKKWLKKHCVIPAASLSLQNTNFRTGFKIPNYIYIQQSIPFSDNKWSLFKREERILWFYKKIYPFFIKLFLNNGTKLFVQLEYMRDESSKKFKVSKENIYIITPHFIKPKITIKDQIRLNDNKINLFYPAAPFFYKNHNVLLDALNICEKKHTFAMYFTIEKCELTQNNLDINFLGKVPFDIIVELYNKMDALVFPSYIESYGLPLLEAASYGLPIIAADLPYAREVLKNYEGVFFVKYDNPKEWKDAICKIEKQKKYNQIISLEGDSWNRMFEIINKN